MSVGRLGTFLRSFHPQLLSIDKKICILCPSKSYSSFREYYPDVSWKIIHELDEMKFPPERRRLHPLPRAPNLNASVKPVKYARQNTDYRGPEKIHNKLIYGQYGIQAMEGGELLFGHIEMIRLTVNKKIDEKRMFSVWGIEAPWKSKTKRSTGKRMGGGKADIHHYVTPVKAGRIIIELGGYLDWKEAYWLLSRVGDKLPFRSRFISQNLLDTESLIHNYVQENNINPFANIGYVLAHNYANCQSYISPYYLEWGSVDYK